MGKICAPLVVLVLLSACKPGSRERSGGAHAQPAGEITVFAAASLTDAFKAVALDFEKAYPGVHVSLSFAGSQSLRTQIQNGAQPEVFASANTQHMTTLFSKQLIDAPKTFARNELVIAVPTRNPANIQSLADLVKAERIVLAGKEVPAGAYAEQVLASAAAAYGEEFGSRVTSRVVSRENHVRQTLQKVVLGEADAAIVYATDAASARGKIKAIAIPAEHNATASYPIATLSSAPNRTLGALFVAYVLSAPASKRLGEFGFRPVQ